MAAPDYLRLYRGQCLHFATADAEGEKRRILAIIDSARPPIGRPDAPLPGSPPCEEFRPTTYIPRDNFSRPAGLGRV